MYPSFYKFKAHGFECVLEIKTTLTGVHANLAYPFSSERIIFNAKKGENVIRLEDIFNFFTEQLTYYLNIVADFDYCNQHIERFRNLGKIYISDNLESNEIEELFICMATRFFHEVEGKIPHLEIMMPLFFALLRIKNVEDFKNEFQPPSYMKPMIKKYGVSYHRSWDSQTLRPELLNFEKQMN